MKKKKKKKVITPWLEAKEAALYMKADYRAVLEDFKRGTIRSVRRGRKFLTRTDWVDDYLISLEETGMLTRK